MAKRVRVDRFPLMVFKTWSHGVHVTAKCCYIVRRNIYRPTATFVTMGEAVDWATNHECTTHKSEREAYRAAAAYAQAKREITTFRITTKKDETTDD